MPGPAPTIPDPDAVVSGYRDVMGLYDSDDGVPTYVLADLTADDRWLSIEAGAALSLEEWR